MLAKLPVQVRLSQSRQQLRDMLQTEGTVREVFPRSATMRLLLHGRARQLGAAALAATLLARLPFARKLLRVIPLSAVLRLLISRP